MTPLRGFIPFAIALLAMTTASCRHPAGSAYMDDTARDNSTAAQLMDVTWELTHLGGERVSSSTERRQPFIRFLREGSRLEGSGGCNQFSGAYSVERDTLQLRGPLTSTRMACAERELNTREQRFLGALETLDRYSLNGDRLTLYSRDTPLATFQRTD